ncbi:hypothetical protein ACGF5M_05290 [Gemmatimonadota bacterium]
MLIVMSHNATDDQIRDVVHVIEELGYDARPIPGRQRTAVGLVGNDGRVDAGRLEGLPGVLEVIPVSHPYKQVSREWKEEDTVVTLPNGTRIGGEEIAIIAGPCAVESEEQILQVAHQLRGMGATVLRGGAFKPRTSPYSFQGLGEDGLKLLARAREETGMAVVTEALDPDGASLVAEYADIIQIGARNMHNYALLRRAGEQEGRPKGGRDEHVRPSSTHQRPEGGAVIRGFGRILRPGLHGDIRLDEVLGRDHIQALKRLDGGAKVAVQDSNANPGSGESQVVENVHPQASHRVGQSAVGGIRRGKGEPHPCPGSRAPRRGTLGTANGPDRENAGESRDSLQRGRVDREGEGPEKPALDADARSRGKDGRPE